MNKKDKELREMIAHQGCASTLTTIAKLIDEYLESAESGYLTPNQQERYLIILADLEGLAAKAKRLLDTN